METSKPAEKWSMWIWIGIVALGASARLLPHPWNFTPLVGIGVFAGIHARRFSTAALATLLSLVASDVVLGFYKGFWWVYAAALLPVLFARLARQRGVPAIIVATASSSLAFFLTTNFAVWAAGQLYPRTVTGLAACYVAAIPFYANQLAGDACYSLIMFGGYWILTRWLPRTPEPAVA